MRALLICLFTGLTLAPLAGCASSASNGDGVSGSELRGRSRARSRGSLDGPRVLGVIAHPDDETTFAAAAWAISRRLNGAVDLVVITNGEGGFKYSTLGEELYGLELTREAVGRAELPRIRRREMEEAARILGVRELSFLSERDHRYTQDEGEILGPEAEVWDLGRVQLVLDRWLARGDYDAAFCLLPTEQTHGHHKAATLLLLAAVERLRPEDRPVVFGVSVERPGEPGAAADFDVLEGWPLSQVVPAPPEGRPSFDRQRRFGFREALDWGVVVDWVIAAHKSQGTLSMMSGAPGREVFHRFELGPPDAVERTRELFEALDGLTYPAREYGPSAGARARR